MKRIDILFVVIITALLSACSGHSLDSQARERAKTHIKNVLSDRVKKYDIQDIEIVYSGDSLCVIQYKLDGENFSGEKANISMEYYIMWTPRNRKESPKLVETFYPLSEKKSILDRVPEMFKDAPLPKDKSEKEHTIRVAASVLDFFVLSDVKE